MEPPIVPKWRTAGSPIMPASFASTGIACCTTGEVLTSLCRVMAPMVIERPLISMPDRPSTSDRSTSCEGLARRSFMVGSSVWPPAKILASSSLANRLAACRTVCGRLKVKAYIFSPPFISISRRSWREEMGSCRVRQLVGPLQHRPDRSGRCRHVDDFGAQGIGDGVHHRSRCRDGTGLAAAFDAERVRRTSGEGGVDLERRKIVGARHGVIHVRAGHQLPLVVIDGVLEQRLADALGDAAMDLALDDHRIDHGAEIVDRGPGSDLGIAGFGIDLDLADMAAGREGEIGRIVERALLEAGLNFAGGE